MNGSQRFRLAALLVSVLMASAVAGFGAAERASACSIASLTSRDLQAWVVPNSHIVALGTFVASSDRVAHFRVDRSLKGSAPGEVLAIDNRGTFAGFTCNPYDEPVQLNHAHRFRQGEERILVLEKEDSGLWQLAWSSHAAFEIPASLSEAMTMDSDTFLHREMPDPESPTFNDLEAAASLPSGVPAREPIVGSSPAERIGGNAVVLPVVGAVVVMALGSFALVRRRQT
jgi:hypothetical protein